MNDVLTFCFIDHAASGGAMNLQQKYKAKLVL